MPNRLAKLARLIGSECAQREFGWMKHSQRRDLQDMLERRIAGEPLQYILGTTPFGPLDLLTRPPTLIPRPETEDWALRLARTCAPTPARPVRVLDLCTGSGCIPLLLCHLWPPGSTRAVGVDISPDAIRLAADNSLRSRPSTRPRHLSRPPIAAAAPSNLRDPKSKSEHPLLVDVDVDVDENVFVPLLGDVCDPRLAQRLRVHDDDDDDGGPFDVITANPPYVRPAEYDSLPSSVRDYEDPRALIGGDEDGLSFYRTIAAFVARPGVLAKHASLALEVGHDQAHAVRHILCHTPHLRLAHIEIWKDPWNKARVVFARAA